MQTVQHLEDALAQGCAPHNAVIDNHEVVDVGPQTAVADVIDVRGKVVALGPLGDEGAQLDVLPHHLLNPHIVIESAKAVGDAVEGHLGGVGDIGEDRVGHVTVYRLHNGLDELLAQTLALLIDVAVGAAAEVDALKRAGAQLLRGKNLFQTYLPVLMDNDGLSRLKFRDVVCGEIEGGLNHRPLAGEHHHLIVTIIKSRPDTPRVAHGEHLARASHPAHHIAAVKVGHRGAQHVGHRDVVFNVVGDVRVLQSLLLGLPEEPLGLAVKAVAHQLQSDVRVAVNAGRLALFDQQLEDLVDVGHIEIAAKAEILGPPVVAAQEGMHV